MEMTRFNLRFLTNYQSIVGDGPFFDCRNNAFYYVDVGGKIIHRVTLKDYLPDHEQNLNKSFQDCSLIRSIQKRQFEEITNFVIPIEEDENIIIMNLGKSLVIYDFDNSKLIDNIYLDNLKKNEFFTTGKCDNKNCLFIGTYTKSDQNEWTPKGGSLYCLDGRIVRRLVGDLNYPNGMAWSQDSEKFFFIDSGDRIIYECDFDKEKRYLKSQKILIDLKLTPLEGRLNSNLIELPYGCVIDQEDNLWIALRGGGRVVKFNPQTCKILESIETGFLNTTSICFGKVLDKDVLFITSAKSQEDNDQRSTGKCLIVQTKDTDLKPTNPIYLKFWSTR